MFAVFLCKFCISDRSTGREVRLDFAEMFSAHFDIYHMIQTFDIKQQIRSFASKVENRLGHSQNHLAVAGGCAASLNRSASLRTHPLPRGGSDCIQ